MTLLSSRHTALRPHPEQLRYIRCNKRFIIAPSGRRSGKTEIAKRKLFKRAMSHCKPFKARILCAAPTHDQAKEIYWDDIKALFKGFIVKRSESERFIELENGVAIHVAGMDKPERAEGSPLDGIILDEFANMKSSVWPKHVRPALDTPGRPGWAIIPSVPEGRNHYYKLYESAIAEIAERGEASDWAVFHWKSADIMDAAAIEQAKRDLDQLTFQQEYEGSFVNFSGLAYYEFNRNIHAAESLAYNPRRPLIFCFDFNTKPGIAVVCQIQDYYYLEPLHRPEIPRSIVAVIGEVHIPTDSNTPMVCRRLIQDWSHHVGPVYLYGDSTGGARTTTSIEGSNWDLIKREFRAVPNWEIVSRVPRANPHERSRVNAMNSRLKTNGILVDPVRARHVVEDFEAVVVVEGGTGELLKKAGDPHTHITDALGYLIAYEYPINDRRTSHAELV